MPLNAKTKKFINYVTDYYTGRAVPKQYQSKFGSIYDEKEARQVAFATVRKHRKLI